MPAPLSARVVRRRLVGLGVVFSLLLTVAVAQLADVQAIHPQRYRATGDQQRIVNVSLQSARGAILDRNGQDLALSVPQSTVVADPTQVSDVAKEAATLSPILGIDSGKLASLLRTKSQFVYLARLISDAAAAKVNVLRSKGDLDGIDLIQEYKRFQPGNGAAAAVLGQTDIDGTGISGLERQYQKTLVGTPGQVQYEKSSLGPIVGGQRKIVPSEPGDDVTLSIDQQLQYESERLVAAQVTATGSKGGIAIISNPSTGEILSMVNMTADPKTKKVTPSTNNEALTTVFEPGSVNKVITVAAALEDKKVTPATVLPHPDTLTLGGASFGEAETLPGQLSVTDILTVSSNIGTIELAQKVGKTQLNSYLHGFGFGRTTGLAFPNESPGLLLPPAQWSGSSIGSIPIGQGISVTPMQMLDVYNTIANNGVFVAPKLVTATVDSAGVSHPTPRSPTHRVISPLVAQQVRGMLANVVKVGTGTNAAVPGYQVAGKTGTARKPLTPHQPGNGYLDLDGHYHYISTFVGMVPADKPALSIIVVLDEPDSAKSYYASDTSAPLFGELARTALRLLHIPPSSSAIASAGVPEVNRALLATAGTEAAVGPGAAPTAGGSTSSAPTTGTP